MPVLSLDGSIESLMSHMQKPFSLDELTGHCQKCHDLFTIYVYRIRGEIRVVENKWLKWEGQQLIHKPTLCNGEVSLYGTLERLVPPAQDGRDHTPRTISPPASKR